jgi:DNA-binding transcriptional LysR family regulator
VDSPALATRYVLGGEGITLADAQLFDGQIRRGELVSPFAAELDTGCACYLVRHPEGLADPATTLLRTCLLEHLALLPPAASSAEGPRAHVPPFARGRLAHSFELLPRSRDLR